MTAAGASGDGHRRPSSRERAVAAKAAIAAEEEARDMAHDRRATAGQHRQRVRDWIDRHLEERHAAGEFGDALTDGVCVLAPREDAILGIEIHAERAAIPDWSDVEADLPIREGGVEGGEQ